MLERTILETAIDENGKITAKWQLSEGDGVIVTVEENVAGKTADIRFDGKLRSDTLFFLQDELMMLAAAGVDIEVDCSKLLYIANNCKKSLIEVQQLMDKISRCILLLKGMPHDLYTEFKVTGMTGALEIEEAV